jgi:ribosomal protein L16 Arg81 hydroxylase
MAALDVQTLARGLIGTMEIQNFNSEVRERKAAKFEAAVGLEHLDQLFSLSRLESLIKSETVPNVNIDLFDHGNLRRLVDVQHKSGKSGLAVVAGNFRNGATIRVRDVDKFDAPLGVFAREVQRFFTAQSQINVYLTPPAKTGFPPHFDTTDVFIVQCLGSKDWEIVHDYSAKMELPLMETVWDPERFRPSAPGEAITLHPGDVLYLPRGAMHRAACTERESMHLTISIVPLTFADLIAKTLKLAAEGDAEYRRRVPWSLESDERELEKVAAKVKNQIRKLADQVDTGAVLQTQRRLLEAEPEADSSGMLESAIASLVKNTG